MTLRAAIFDLDGTLVETERLKADSFAHAVQELRPEDFDPLAVAEIYNEFVGLSRKEVALGLLRRFNVEAQNIASLLPQQQGVVEPWQVVIGIRHRHYHARLADARLIQSLACPHSIALLPEARRMGLKLGLATMSTRDEMEQVLCALSLASAFDVTASQDEIHNGKPDPEIYRLVGNSLGIPPGECLVIEDSLSGIQAALAAGMHCIAATTDFTRAAVHAAHLLDERWIVDDPTNLSKTFMQRVNDQVSL